METALFHWLNRPTCLLFMGLKGMLIGIVCLLSFGATADVVEVYEFDTPAQEAQYHELIKQLRCPKCDNQSLAGSQSPIAQDLKHKTHELVLTGHSDEQIMAYMIERYGDEISYKPPIRPTTYVLWFLPPLVLLIGLVWWFWHQRVFAQASDDDDFCMPQGVHSAQSTEVSNMDSSGAMYPSCSAQRATYGLSNQEQAQLDRLLAKSEANMVSQTDANSKK